MLKGTLTRYKVRLQGELFPVLRETFGALSSKQEQLVTVLGLVAVESFLPHYHGVVGRPEAERAALARAFIAKAVYNLLTTRTRAMLRQLWHVKNRSESRNLNPET